MQNFPMGALSVHSFDDGTSENSVVVPAASAASTCASAVDVGTTRRRAGDKTRALFVKTEYCRFHAEGKCSRGEKCSFAHGGDELRVRPNLTNTTICHFWVNGRCLQGQNCAFAHGVDELRSVPGKPKPRRIRASRARRPSQPEEDSDGLAPIALEVALPLAPGPTQKPDALGGPRTCARCGITSSDTCARFCSRCGAAFVAAAVPPHLGPFGQMVQVVTSSGQTLMAIVPNVPGSNATTGPTSAEATKSVSRAAPNLSTPNYSGFQWARSASLPFPAENPYLVSTVLDCLRGHQEKSQD